MAAIKQFFSDLFSTNLNDYGSFEGDFNISYLVLFLSLGILVAVVAMNLLNSASCTIIRALVRYEAFGEESAKGLSEIGLEKNLLARYALSANTKLCRTYIKAIGERELSYEEFIALPKKEQRRYGAKRDIDGKLFIPADMKTRAEDLVSADTSSILQTLISCLFVLAVCFVILLLLPPLLTFMLGAKV